MSEKGVLLVVSGFSGAGKGTIVKKLLADRDDVSVSVSMTTRNPRPGEVDGKDYFFVTKEKFEETIAADGLIEYAQYVSNYYGTPKSYVMSELEKGRNVILEIETQGALQVKKKFQDAILIFVTTPSVSILLDRLRGRGTETEDVIAGRIAQAKNEVNLIEQYDYLLVNDDLNKCVNNLCTLIDASRMAPSCNNSFVENLKKGFETV